MSNYMLVALKNSGEENEKYFDGTRSFKGRPFDFLKGSHYYSEKILSKFGLRFTSKCFEIHKILRISCTVKMLKDYVFFIEKVQDWF